jgi:hypothetical protein
MCVIFTASVGAAGIEAINAGVGVSQQTGEESVNRDGAKYQKTL